MIIQTSYHIGVGKQYLLSPRLWVKPSHNRHLVATRLPRVDTGLRTVNEARKAIANIRADKEVHPLQRVRLSIQRVTVETKPCLKHYPSTRR